MAKKAIFFMILAVVAAPIQAGEKVRYSYDSLGRLKSALYEGGVSDGKSTTYSYDPAGNRTQVAVNAQPGGNCSFLVEDGVFVFDPEFPSTGYHSISVRVAGACTQPTTLQYSFSEPRATSGTYVVQPLVTGFSYNLPTPCAWGTPSPMTTTIQIISGPGTITKASGNINLEC